MVDHAPGEPCLLVRPFDEISETLFARVDPSISDDSQEPNNPPHPSVELVLFDDGIEPSVLLVEINETLFVRAQALSRLHSFKNILELYFPLE